MTPPVVPPDPATVEDDVRRALAEDVRGGDVTASLLPDGPDIAYLLCKEDAVVAGRPWFDATHRAHRRRRPRGQGHRHRHAGRP